MCNIVFAFIPCRFVSVCLPLSHPFVSYNTAVDSVIFWCIIHKMWRITNCIWFFMCNISGCPFLLYLLLIASGDRASSKRNYASTQRTHTHTHTLTQIHLECFIINANGKWKQTHNEQMLISNFCLFTAMELNVWHSLFIHKNELHYKQKNPLFMPIFRMHPDV